MSTLPKVCGLCATTTVRATHPIYIERNNKTTEKQTERETDTTREKDGQNNIDRKKDKGSLRKRDSDGLHQDSQLRHH